MSHVASINALVADVPIAIVIPVTEPRLDAQIMYGEIHPPGQAVPPHEDLVEEALVAAVVRNDVVRPPHEQVESAIRRLQDHHAGVENGAVVPGGRNLREIEQKIDVAEDDYVGIDEDYLVVVRFLLGSRVSNPLDEPEFPPGFGQHLAFGFRDSAVQEEDKVAFGSGSKEALC
nr:hypothetical protein PanWU01x14_282420 [Ipomoea batatas]GMD22181.1 hypothetical protein PanWU01x14_282420 [Ipomoea batatas]GMD42831.1 hypothetical protein PanWU01x14_282420 [Ipomoea batatas]GMD94551.1 hypothetical protein PanWU01x14_282420 [Ipomoea batatas]